MGWKTRSGLIARRVPWLQAVAGSTLFLAALALALLVPLLASAGGPSAAAAADDSPPTDRLIIKYRATHAGAAATAAAADRAELHRPAQDAAARLGLRLQLLRVGALDAHVMRLERRMAHADVERLARDIMATDPAVEYAEPDRILKPMLTPTDTQYGQQWQYFESIGGLNLPAAWDKATGTGVVVAVIDTGYRPHADLAANIVPGYDFIADTFVWDRART